MDEELLINLVHKHRELYDIQHPKYDENSWRNKIWEEIGVAVKAPGSVCKSKWKRIRDNYRKAKKLRRSKGGQAAIKMKKIKYDDILGFINQHMEGQYETDSNFSAPSPTHEEDELEPRYLVAEDGCETTLTEDNVVLSSRSKFPYSVNEKYGNNYQAACTSSMYEEKYDSTNENRIVKFFSNLGETVATFPEAIQIRVKREVFRLVNDAEEEVQLMKNS